MTIDRSKMRAARRIVILQAATVATLLIGAGLVAISAGATTVDIRRSTIGRTWAIVEPDALAEIEAKVATLPKDMGKAFGPRSQWSAMKAAELGVAPADHVRSVVPFYTLDFDVTLPDGRILYPKGYSFNPLTYVTMPQRLVVVHPRDLAWALKTARPSDFVLLTALGRDNADPIALGEKAGRAIYILEERVKQRLGLTLAPVIVAQAGQHLVLTEYGPKSRAVSRGATR